MIKKLTMKQAYCFLIIVLGSGFIAFSTFIMLMYATSHRIIWGGPYPSWQNVFTLNSRFFINGVIVLISLLTIEVMLLGGFSKRSRNSRKLLVPLAGIVLTLFWAIFQFFTEIGIIFYSIINGLLLAYCGYAGNSSFTQTPRDLQQKSFTLIEQLLIPGLTSGLFLFIVLNIESQGDYLLEGGIFFIMILLSLVIVTLLNYKQSPLTRFGKLVLQFLGVWLFLLIWFFFITSPFLISYDNSSHFRDSAIPFDIGSLFALTLVAIVCGTFYLWDNVLDQINQARQSPQQSQQISRIQPNTAIHQSLQSNDTSINNQLICPNCNTLLEQDAIRELRAKKTVFCALCGDQLSIPDLFGDEKESVIREHNQLLEKFTKLPPIKVDRSEE